MKVSKDKFTPDEIQCITEVMERKKVPAEHPAYPVFLQKYSAFCPADENHIMGVWNELIEGYRIQLKNAEDALKKATNREYLNTVNSNPHFRNAVDIIKRDGGVRVPANEKLALWSGGYALSVAIRDMGFCTLEKTPFGNILDNLWVTWDWKREGGLWNILSAAFVEEYEPGREVHIYFRTVDEMSVLYEQELPMIMGGPERQVVFHPIYNQGTVISEVGWIKEEKRAESIVLSPNNCAFRYLSRNLGAQMSSTDTEFEPYKALLDTLKRQNIKANRQVYLSYRSDKFIPGRAPFAREDEPTSGADSQKEERQKYWG